MILMGRDPERVALAAFVVVAAAAILLQGCAAPWETARGAITGAQAVLDQVDELVPDGEDADRAISATRAGLELGQGIVNMWEEAKETPMAWPGWVTHALGLAADLLDLIKAAGVDIPAPVTAAVVALQLLLPVLS